MSSKKVDYEKIRDLLLERRSRILGQLRQAKDANGFHASDVPLDSVEEAWGRFDQDMVANISDAWSREITEIDNALENIEKRDYGVCTYCGDAIAPSRLQARPSALLCITCQEQYDEAQMKTQKPGELQFSITDAGMAAAFGV